MSEENIYAAPQSTEVINQGDENVHIPLTLKEKLFGFQGRISRAGYWGYNYGWILLASVPAIVVYLILVFMFASDPEFTSFTPAKGITMGILALVMILLYIVPCWMSIAVMVKRYHDRGKSGWWALIVLIPYVGGIWVLIDCGCIAGDKGKNIFGDDPLLADGKTHDMGGLS